MTTTTTVTTTTETTVQPETSRVRATLHDVVVGDVEIHGDGDEFAWLTIGNFALWPAGRGGPVAGLANLAAIGRAITAQAEQALADRDGTEA